MTGLPELFMTTWNAIRDDEVSALAHLYHEDCVFIDPVHEIHGLPALEAYCRKLYAGVEHCRFRFAALIVGDGKAALPWVMELRMKKFRRGETIELPGISEIRFDRKIHHHRDYFDLGDLVYERVMAEFLRRLQQRGL